MLHYIIGLFSQPFSLLFILPLLRSGMILARRDLRGRAAILHELGLMLFGLYIATVIGLTLNIYGVLRGDFSIGYRYNLIPCAGIAAVIQNGTPAFAALNIIGNVLMFMPLGLFLPLLWRRWSFKRVILAGALASFTIEILQFFTGRSADIDDILLNAFGALIGYLFHLALRRALPSLAAAFRLRAKWRVVPDRQIQLRPAPGPQFPEKAHTGSFWFT